MEEIAKLSLNRLEFWSCNLRAHHLQPLRRMASLASLRLGNDYSELRGHPTEP